MKKNLFRIFSFIILATAIISCAGDSNPLIKEAKDGIKAKNYDAALASLDSAIVQDSANANAYYYKGVVYKEMAQNNSDVSDRKDSYRKMRENLLTANDMFTAQGIQSIESVESELMLSRTWGAEHNTGIAYAVGDTTVPKIDNPLEVSISHFKNAIVINPDSIISIDVLAEVYRMQGNYAEAANAMERVIELKEKPAAIDYDRLASFYLQEDEFTKAENILITATDVYPDSVSLFQKLADTYTSQQKNDKAIAVLERLLETDPDNSIYHLVLSTQVYGIADKKNQTISANYDSLFTLNRELRNLSGSKKRAVENSISTLISETETLEKESKELSDRAIEELQLAIKSDPSNPNIYYTLGVINQNTAATLFDKRNAADDDSYAEIDAQAKDYLREAMINYEKAAELNPDDESYWRSLFQVYTTLGMNEKAEAAMEKAGM